MHDLRLVGVHEDGEHLLLSAPDGEQFLLTVDEALRAAVRRDRAHLGQLQIEMSGDLRPREVQAQIRAGATAEEVAERSGWPVDRVRRYEGAVLAEREHITEVARSVTLRRRGSDASPPTLTTRVDQRLAGRGVDPHKNVWDSYRPDDGPWILTLRFAAGGRERDARWIYDPVARTVTPHDDEALWLSEDERPPAPPQAAPHLASVPTVSAMPVRAGEERIYDLAADGGLDPAEPESESESEAESESAAELVTLGAPSAVDLVGAMRQRRHGRRRQTGSGGGPDNTPEQAPLDLEPLTFDPTLLGDPPAAHPFPFPERLRSTDSGSASGSDEPPAPESDALQGGDASDSDHTGPPPQPRNFGPPPSTTPTTSTTTSVVGVADSTTHRRARRASVPSWDEIMFGGKRD